MCGAFVINLHVVSLNDPDNVHVHVGHLERLYAPMLQEPANKHSNGSIYSRAHLYIDYVGSG